MSYINDSKATNVGASISAVEGFSKGKNIILILGGEGKGADFELMIPAIKNCVKKVLVFGRDGKAIRAVLRSAVSIELVDNLDDIVDAAILNANGGDTVLFSPACASFDMFENYSTRGDEFKRLLLEKLS